MYVLMIEDNEDDVILVSRDLAAIGDIHLAHCATLSAGLAHLKAHEVNVLLLDLSLPETDGLTALEQIQKQFPALPVIILTGNDMDGVALEAARRGAQDYLVKGKVNAQVLSRSLRYAVERKRLEEQLRSGEEQFHTAFKYAAIGIALVGLDGSWLEVNQALCGIVGYSEQELLTKTFQDITHPDDLDTDLTYVRQLLGGELESYQMEKRYFHKLGHEVWVLLSVSLVHDIQGKPLHFISQIQDITPRKQAEAALTAERNLLRMLIDNIPDYIFLKDTQSRFVLANQAMLNAGGFSSVEQILGKQDFDFFPAEIAQAFYEDEQSVMASGTALVNREERSVDLQTGQEVWFSTTKVPLRDEQGIVTGLLGVSWNITARKQAEQQTLELVRERERVMLLSDFVRDISHDFRTPLAIISTNLYLLSKVTDPEKRKTMLDKAEGQILRLTQIIDRLLVMARLDSEVSFSLQRVDANRLVADMCALLSFNAKEKNISILPAFWETNLMVRVEPTEIKLALAELAGNALFYTPAEGTIAVRATRQDNRAVIEVSDTGIGISSAELPHIFQRLYRVDAARTQDGGGAGLGLSIARRIVDLHDGTITAESVFGQGSIFKVFLPLME